jgi:hypothetical protein
MQSTCNDPDHTSFGVKVILFAIRIFDKRRPQLVAGVFDLLLYSYSSGYSKMKLYNYYSGGATIRWNLNICVVLLGSSVDVNVYVKSLLPCQVIVPVFI